MNQKITPEVGEMRGETEVVVAAVGLPTLAPGEKVRPSFSDTHPRAARELGEMFTGERRQ